MGRSFLFVAVLALLIPSAPAATASCSEPTAAARVTGPQYSEPLTDEAYAREMQSPRPLTHSAPLTSGGTIPVYVHVLTKKESSSANVTDEQITDQIAVLNDAFDGTGWTFAHTQTTRNFGKGYAEVEIRSRAEKRLKSLLRQGSAGDLNLYIVKPSAGVLGWATFPADYEARPTYDGVVIHHRSMPGNGSRRWPYGEGDTAVHEIGHWMGLFHTFQGRCEGGDLVDDTEPERKPTFGCPANKDTCNGGGPDPVQNFMDYSDDACIDHFTPGQDDRMDAQWSAYRAQDTG